MGEQEAVWSAEPLAGWMAEPLTVSAAEQLAAEVLAGLGAPVFRGALGDSCGWERCCRGSAQVCVMASILSTSFIRLGWAPFASHHWEREVDSLSPPEKGRSGFAL